MKKLFLVSLCCLMMIGHGVLRTSVRAEPVWEEAFYQTYDERSFRRYGPVQQTIDFDNIHYPLLNAAIFYETNRVRIRNGIRPFVHAAPLEEAAFMHARDMVRLDFFSHENPYEPEKKTLIQRLNQVGVVNGYRAENISEVFGIRYEHGTMIIPPDQGGSSFRDYRTGKAIPAHTYLSFAETLLESWMKSSGHRANILNENLLFLGCGAYHYVNDAFYGMHQFKAVQNFASVVPGK